MEEIPHPTHIYRNILVLILVVASVLNLTMAGWTSFTSSHMDVSMFWIIALGTCVLLLSGGLALYVTRDVPSIRRIGLWAGMLFGTILGALMAIAASGPNDAAMGVAFLTLLPWFFLLSPHNGLLMALFVLSPHIVMILVLGGSAFWATRLSGKVRSGIGSVLLLTCIVTCFTILVGFVMTFVLGKLDMLSMYDAWGMLFALPFPALLVYTLTVGTLGALLGRIGTQRMVPSIL
ncbi:hypothetical protein [Ktedonospora formicarum]|uniref:Uncharacterized protein n=1 Tax=Ktedonospora formicarum TaxID=2778364 RepID=A0A8J3HY23_9CHLR|nr:hypothetical protein [Ktedonospora formicarum]GHO46307.1 hypothetical protein KSX_44700 [Ktedonospora formicarum]